MADLVGGTQFTGRVRIAIRRAAFGREHDDGVSDASPIVQLRRREAARMLDASIHQLRTDQPELSAWRTLSRQQRIVLGSAAVAFVAATAVAPFTVATVGVAAATTCYLATLAFRLQILRRGLTAPAQATISAEDARALTDAELPVYTVLVPAYREPEVLPRLLRNLDAIEYPRHKLDVKLLLEQDDHATVAVAERLVAGGHVEILLVPPGEPRTKPKACNFGLQRARGELVTIYDAEDRPDPLQLRRAVAAFRQGGPDLVCLQAKLTFFNADQNLLTRWFTAEYQMWFSHLLPGLLAMQAPLPLGGTSNHIRTDVLRAVGGWDPFNVTEDADLGIRLHRDGWYVGILDSVTEEEANSDAVNWVKQRSRWYKGYLQTWLVHMRHPVRLRRELGSRGFVGFNLFVGGTPLLALANPLFWTLTLLWFGLGLEAVAQLFPTWLYYAALVSFVVGNLVFAYGTIVSAYTSERGSLVPSALLIPLYWALMSAAAVKATIQLLTNPSFWEKTQHGLDATQAVPVPRAAGEVVS